MSPATQLGPKINVQLSFVQTAYWLSFVAVGGFSAVLLQSKNFTPSEIGILLALQSLASIIAQPLLSGFADRHKKIPLKFFVIGMMVLAILAFGSLYFLPHILLPAVLIFLVMGVSYTCVPAFVNAIAMQLTAAGFRVNYGLTRGLGSLAFAATGSGLGFLIDSVGTGVIVPFFVIAGSLCVIAIAFLTRPFPSSKSASARRKKDAGTDSFGELSDHEVVIAESLEKTVSKPDKLLHFLRTNKTFTGFCISSALIFTSHACINNFLPNIVDGLDGSFTDQGNIRSIAALVEFPIMFLYFALSRRVTGNKLLIFSAFSFFLKAVTTMIAPGVGWLYLIQLLQMPAFGLYTPSAVVFSDSSVSEKNRVRAQALAMASTFGIGNVIGSLGGGFVIDAFGLNTMLILSSVFGFAGFLIMFFVLREKREPKTASV